MKKISGILLLMFFCHSLAEEGTSTVDDDASPDFLPEFLKLVEQGETSGESEAVPIPLSNGGVLSKTTIELLKEAGFDDFVEAAKAEKLSSTAPLPPVLEQGVIPVPTVWLQGSYSNKADWFYQSWTVDGKAWVTNGSEPNAPRIIAKRMVIWFTSTCESRSKAAEDTSEIVMHEYWNNHNAPPPGQGYCVVDKPCILTAVIVNGETGFNRICL